jgi:hypothetical protein
MGRYSSCLSQTIRGGAIMSLVVNTNADGTFTVTCGAESVTVGRPSGQGGIIAGGGGVATTLIRTKRPKREPSSWPIIPGGGGVATTIVKLTAPNDIKDIHVLNAAEILASIKAHRPTAAKAKAPGQPVLLRFHVPYGTSLDMAPVSQTMRALGTHSTLRAEVLFADQSDE